MVQKIYKAVAFVRVSSVAQHLESQKQEVYNVIHRHGYSDDECVYVGQSKNIEARCESHLRNKEKFNGDGYFYECLESFDFYDLNMLLDREAYWINKMEPTFNIIRNRSMPDSVKLKVSESGKCLPETEYGKQHKILMRLQRTKEKKKLQYYYDFFGNRIYF